MALRSSRKKRSEQEAQLLGATNELQGRMHAEYLHHRVLMSFDGAHREPEIGRDLLGAQPTPDQAQYLALFRSEVVYFLELAAEVSRAERGRHIDTARQNLAHCGHEILARRVLQYVAIGARAHRGGGERGLG